MYVFAVYGRPLVLRVSSAVFATRHSSALRSRSRSPLHPPFRFSYPPFFLLLYVARFNDTKVIHTTAFARTLSILFLSLSLSLARDPFHSLTRSLEYW